MRKTIELHNNKKTAGIKICDSCGSEKFYKKPRRWDICSSCERKDGVKSGRRIVPKRYSTITFINFCEVCNKVYAIKSEYHREQKYCSSKCYSTSMYSKGIICSCGKPIKNNCKTSLCDKCREKEWVKNNKERHNDNANNYQKKRRAIDVNFKLCLNLRRRLWDALHGKSKSEQTLSYLGCSIEDLKSHIEKQFTGGMSWDNWAKDGWHIDHKRPISWYDLTKEAEIHKACNYKNLQPLWAKDNYAKRNRYES